MTIKYRVWDKRDKRMYDWEKIKDLFSFDEMEHDDLVWQQYTGLNDRNDREIYGGDIVRVNHDDGYETIGQVEWGLSSKWFGTYPAFAIAELESEINSFAEIFDTGQYTIEVIGNIYENPELLEVSA